MRYTNDMYIGRGHPLSAMGVGRGSAHAACQRKGQTVLLIGTASFFLDNGIPHQLFCDASVPVLIHHVCSDHWKWVFCNVQAQTIHGVETLHVLAVK
jgi:hypothetical protein